MDTVRAGRESAMSCSVLVVVAVRYQKNSKKPPICFCLFATRGEEQLKGANEDKDIYAFVCVHCVRWIGPASQPPRYAYIG